MFSVMAFVIWIIALPFVMGPSVGFHAIKEKKRYEVNRLPTPSYEKLLNGVCLGIIVGMFYFKAFFPSLILPYDKIFGGCLMVVVVFYLYKIGGSLFSQKSITVLIGFSLRSRGQKILMFLLFGILFMVALENLHIISTYIK